MTPDLCDLLDKGTQAACVPKMMTHAELYDALGYTGYEARDRAYFGGAGAKSRDVGGHAELQNSRAQLDRAQSRTRLS